MEPFSLGQPSNTTPNPAIPLRLRGSPQGTPLTPTLHLTAAQLLEHGLPWESCL